MDLLAVKRRRLTRVWAVAQDGHRARELLYIAAVRTTRASKNTVKLALTPDYQLGNWLVMSQ
jgi:hypothetical protein